MKKLPSVRSDLLRHKLDDDLLVYDPASDQVHLLNSSTAAVVEMLDKGTDEAKIVSDLGGNRPEAGAEILALALDQLAAAKLTVAAPEADASVLGNATRRQMVQTLMGVSAALLVPAIVTLAPRSAGAQGSNLPNGSACRVSSQCASGCCGANSSGACTSNVCVDKNPPTPGGCSNCTAG